jgi:D-alanine--poly(phosphoribitol) ligase subunit 2
LTVLADSTTVARVRLLIEDALSIDSPGDDVDLIETGLIDSLGLVTVIAEIEQEFQITFALDDLDVDQFRTIHRIVALLEKLLLP